MLLTLISAVNKEATFNNGSLTPTSINTKQLL